MKTLRRLAGSSQVPGAAGLQAPSEGDKSSPHPLGSLQLRDLWVDLRGFHLQGIDLDVAAREYVVVLGPTGAGKTVLLETIAGLFQPRRGRILMDGEDIYAPGIDVHALRRQVEEVGQDTLGSGVVCREAVGRQDAPGY